MTAELDRNTTPPEPQLTPKEEAALRTALAAWIESGTPEAVQPRQHSGASSSLLPAVTVPVVSVPAQPRPAITSLEPVHRIPAAPGRVVETLPAPHQKRWVLPLLAAASFAAGVLVCLQFLVRPVQPTSVSQLNGSENAPPTAEIAARQELALQHPSTSAPPARGIDALAKTEQLTNSAAQNAVQRPSAQQLQTPSHSQPETKIATLPVPDSVPPIASAGDLRAGNAPGEFLPDVPAIPAVVPPAAEKAAAPAKMAAAAAAIAARNAEARLKSDNPGQHLDSATQWATIGTLPVIASARRLEISLRNEGGAHAYGGMICLRPWNLMEAPVSLQFDARNLLARSSQDLDFIITDDLKLKNDMRQLSIQAALNLKRVRSKLATGASPQRIEVVFSRSQNGSVRQELRAGNEVLLTRYSEKLRDLRHVYIGFRASTRHDSSHTVLSIDNVKLAYRPRTVPWISSFEDAQTLAQARGEAFCVYFCDPESAKLAGEGPAALAEYKAGHIQTPPPSVFETPLVLAEFQSAGVDLFVKIPAAPENAQLFARYADRLPALILCAPDGTRLGGFTGVECKQTALVKFLSSEFSDVLSQWHASQKASRPAAATPTLELPPAAVAIPERQVFQLLPLHESLPRAYRFSARVAAGPRVATAEQYRVLKDMGVKTLLSVDGTAPDGAACEALKIRGVHLPLGFAGFTTEQTRALARALRDLPAPVYVQAAEGTRAYTASALALVVLGQIEPADAIGALKTAGVPSLSALYSAVASARPDAQAAELNTIAFAPHAPVSPLVQEMLQIDTIWRRLEKARAQGWRVSEEGRGELARDAHLLLERYLELSKSETITHDKAKAMMSDSVAAAASLAYTLAAWKKNPGAEEMATVNAGFNRTTASCLNCHAQVRDRKK